MIKLESIPRGEIITSGAICFPVYSKSGFVHASKGVALIGGYHLPSQSYLIFGEEEFTSLKPSVEEDKMIEFLVKSPIVDYYNTQGLETIKRYRKEINFASGLADIDLSIIRLKDTDDSQNRFTIWEKIHSGKLKYIKDGLVYKGVKEYSVAKDVESSLVNALACLLNSIDKKLYNDQRFDSAIGG